MAARFDRPDGDASGRCCDDPGGPPEIYRGPSVEDVRQLVDDGRYRDAEQVARELLPEVENETGSASLATAEVLDLLAEALWRGGKFNLPGTVEVANRSLLIRESQLGRESLLFADSLVRKAEILTAADEHAEAEHLLVWAVRIYEESEDVEVARLVRAHDRLGRLYRVTRQIAEAEWHSMLAVEMARADSSLDELLVAEALYGLARLHIDEMSDTRFVEPMTLEVLSKRKEWLGEEHPLVAETTFLLGEAIAEGSRYQEGLELQTRSLESMEKTLGSDHPLVARRLFDLAVRLWVLGDPVRSEEALLRSAAIFSGYPEMVLSAKTYHALGFLRLTAGDLVSAWQFLDQALGIAERAYGPDSAESGSTLNNLGVVAYELGEMEEAKRYFERGLGVSTETFGVGSEATAVFILSLAEVYLALGDFETAEDFARRAWSIDESFSRSETAGRNLAMVLRKRGKFREAEEILTRVLAAHEAASDLRNSEAVENQVGYADLMVDMGSCEKASTHYRKALSILEDMSGDREPRAASIRVRLSDCLLQTGNPAAAFDQAVLAEQISRNHLRLMLTGMSERVGLQYAASRPLSLDRVISLLLRSRESESIREGVDAVIRSRALVLDEMADRRRTLSIGAASDSASLVADLMQARKRLAYLTVQGPGGGEPEQVDRFQQALEAASRERDRAERALAEANRGFRLSQARRGAGLAEVEGVLSAGSGLVGFVRFERFADGEGAPSEVRNAEPSYSYMAFILRADSVEIGLFDLGGAGEVDELVEQVRAQVVSEARVTLGSSRARERAYRRVAGPLRMLIWDPIEPYLSGLERVFVVPDGALHFVSLAAMPTGEDGYLLESGPRLHYLSAERDLLRETAEVRSRGLLAMGNPEFDNTALFADLNPQASDVIARLPSNDSGELGTYRGPRSVCESFQAMRFEPLPASETEVKDVVAAWSADSPGPGAIELLRGEAAETSFKRLASGRKVLHLSTHGFYLGKDCPVYEFQKLEGDRRVRFADLENPLLRSGLALAGANHRQAASPEEDDGILTAEEVAALDLSGVEWAVLSACESGLGDIQTGEGVFGLRRAFESTGAQTLIMSLWPVDDDATRDWMKSLYRHRFVEGATTIDAVHQANLDLIAARREAGLSTHPFYWAGFVAAGEWR